MFRKLVSNVSFSPALVGQLSFYARRLRQEEAIRRLGLVFTALALVVQSFAVFSAPEPANAANGSDMIYGGIDNKTQLMSAYKNNQRFRNVMDYAGITQTELQNTTAKYINNLSKGTGSSAWKSWGWLSRFSKEQGEVKHNANGTTVYSRPNHLYNNTAYERANGRTFMVFYGHSDKLGEFGIMFDCGNLIAPKLPSPPPPAPPAPPKPKYACASVSRIKQTDPTKYVFRGKSSVENGATATSFTFEFGDGKSQKVKVQRTEGKYAFADAPYTYTKSGTYNVKVTAHFIVNGKTLSATSDNCQKPVTITVPTPEPTNPKIAVEKKVRISSNDTSWTDEAEVLINQDYQYRIVVSNTGDVTLKDIAVSDTADSGITLSRASAGTISGQTWKHTIGSLAPGKSATFTLTAKTDQYTSESAKYLDNKVCVDTPNISGEPDDCDSAAVELPEKPIVVCELATDKLITIKPSEFDASKHSKNPDDCIKIQVCDLETGTIMTIRKPSFDSNKHTRDLNQCQDIQVCNLETGQVEIIKRHDFDASKHSEDAADCVPNIAETKGAVNLTQDGVDATTTLARSGDRIQYTITAHNVGAVEAKANFDENLDDILEYSTVVDNGGGQFDGETRTLSWPDVTLQAGESQSRMFTVQLAANIPAGARGISEASSYDCVMLNTYGNSTEVRIDCPAVKGVEQVVTELPTTGPGENMIFAGILLAVVTYFYARSRQVTQEVRLIRRGLNTGTI